MALDVKDYVKSDAKVKAAQKKLNAANNRVKSAQDSLNKARNATEDVRANIQAELEKANQDFNQAKNDADAAVQAATEYFKANYQSISKKQSKKSLASLEDALSKARTPEEAKAIQGEIDKAKSNIASPQPYKEPVTDSKSNKTIADGTDSTGTLTVDQANANLKKLVDNARDYVYNKLDDNGRLTLAKALGPDGIGNKNVPQTGTYNEYLVQAYQGLLREAINQNNLNKDLKGFQPFDYIGYLTYKTNLANQIAGTGSGRPKPMAYISDRETAASTINSVFQKELNREATSEELDSLTKALNAYEKANPYITGKTSRTGGVDQQEYIRQILSGQSKVKGKKIAGIVDSLNKEYTTKKSDKTQVALDDIRKTALNNGYPLSDTQLNEYATRLKNGETAEVIKKSIRNALALGVYSGNKGISDALKAGDDLSTIYAPYRQTMATILEVPYDKINLNDPTLTQAIGANGNLSLTEYQNMLRKDPRWQYTNNARETVSNGLAQVLRDFGFMG